MEAAYQFDQSTAQLETVISGEEINIESSGEDNENHSEVVNPSTNPTPTLRTRSTGGRGRKIAHDVAYFFKYVTVDNDVQKRVCTLCM